MSDGWVSYDWEIDGLEQWIVNEGCILASPYFSEAVAYGIS